MDRAQAGLPLQTRLREILSKRRERTRKWMGRRERWRLNGMGVLGERYVAFFDRSRFAYAVIVVIGYIVSSTGSFVWALGFIGAMALVGVCSYVFLLGDVRRIDIAE